jgi:hypothetical protein
MSRALIFSYVFTLLCLLLGSPYLLFKVVQRVKGSLRSILHGAMMGICSHFMCELILVPLLHVALLGGLSLQAWPDSLLLPAALYALLIEGMRALTVTRLATHVRSARTAAHFGLGWGCGMAMFFGVHLLVTLYMHQHFDPATLLNAYPEEVRGELSMALERERTELLEASSLQPPLQHVLSAGLNAFFQIAFTLILVRTWTRGDRFAWLRAAGFHAALRILATTPLLHLPGWGGVLLSLLIQFALVAPTYRWMALQIVRSEK